MRHRRGFTLVEIVIAIFILLLLVLLAVPSLNGVLDALDRYSLAAKRPVTLPLVREALEKKR